MTPNLEKTLTVKVYEAMVWQPKRFTPVASRRVTDPLIWTSKFVSMNGVPAIMSLRLRLTLKS